MGMRTDGGRLWGWRGDEREEKGKKEEKKELNKDVCTRMSSIEWYLEIE